MPNESGRPVSNAQLDTGSSITASNPPGHAEKRLESKMHGPNILFSLATELLKHLAVDPSTG